MFIIQAQILRTSATDIVKQIAQVLQPHVLVLQLQELISLPIYQVISVALINHRLVTIRLQVVAAVSPTTATPLPSPVVLVEENSKVSSVIPVLPLVIPKIVFKQSMAPTEPTLLLANVVNLTTISVTTMAPVLVESVNVIQGLHQLLLQP